MKDLLQTKRNKKGFTLAELLIVIAIIAVLIAIAIPVFTAQLEKSRHAVDDGALRSAMSLAVADYMLEGRTGDVYYTAKNVVGTNVKLNNTTELQIFCVSDLAANTTPLGDTLVKAKCTKESAVGDGCTHLKDDIIFIKVNDAEVEVAGWVTADSSMQKSAFVAITDANVKA